MSEKSDYRKALGSFATGVTIITTTSKDQAFGFTANSFTSVSLDPALILFCVKRDSSFLEALENSKIFGVNILSHLQKNTSNKFANPDLSNEQRFNDEQLNASQLNSPIIKGCIAYLDCELEESIQTGDHQIIIGRVDNFSKLESLDPLVYFGGGYRTLEIS